MGILPWVQFLGCWCGARIQSKTCVKIDIFRHNNIILYFIMYFCMLHMLHNATQCYTMLHNATQCHTMPHNATQCYTMLHNATQCYTMLHNATQCYTMLHNATQCYTMLHNATQCYTMLLQCYTMLHNATQCYTVHLSIRPATVCQEIIHKTSNQPFIPDTLFCGPKVSKVCHTRSIYSGASKQSPP